MILRHSSRQGVADSASFHQYFRELSVILNGPGLASQSDMEVEEKRPRLHWDLTERAIGGFFDVYNELGPGFPEFVCRRALVVGLRDAALDVREEVPLQVWFRGNRLITFRADIVIASGPVLIEVKAVPAVEPHHIAQVLTYLKATEVEVALLVNFGKRPQFKRLVFQNERKKALPESRPEDLGTEMCGDLRSSESPAAAVILASGVLIRAEPRPVEFYPR